MQIEDITGAIASRLGVDPAATEKTVGVILSVIEHEAGASEADALFSRIPGAAALAQRYDVATQTGGGLMGMLSSSLGGVFGERTGILVSGLSQLETTGLDNGQLQQAATHLVAYAEQAAGPAVVDRLLSSVPGLKGHFGL